MLELIIDHPVQSIMTAVGILVFFRVLFWFANQLENANLGSKSNSKKIEKEKTVVKDIKEVKEKVSSDTTKLLSEKEKKDDKNIQVSPDGTNASNNQSGKVSNYLYDRYVESPSAEDHFPYSSKMHDAFLSDSEIEAIQKRKIKIRVKENEEKSNNSVYKRLEELSHENVDEREKLLNEFEHLPREMKLLIIKNIMQNVD